MAARLECALCTLSLFAKLRTYQRGLWSSVPMASSSLCTCSSQLHFDPLYFHQRRLWPSVPPKSCSLCPRPSKDKRNSYDYCQFRVPRVLASLLCRSLSVGYSSHLYVRMGSSCWTTIFLFPAAGSLLSLRTISQAAFAFGVRYFWWHCWSCMTTLRCHPFRPLQFFDLSHLIPTTCTASPNASSISSSPPNLTPFTLSMNESGQ